MNFLLAFFLTATHIMDDNRTSRGISGARTVSRWEENTLVIDYRATVLGVRHVGTKRMAADPHYFSEEFRAELRLAGSIRVPEFLITYRGAEGACDLIRLSDFRDDTAPLKNVEMDGTLCPGVPVTGATQVDVRGIMAGQRVRLGMDYRP